MCADVKTLARDTVGPVEELRYILLHFLEFFLHLWVHCRQISKNTQRKGCYIANVLFSINLGMPKMRPIDTTAIRIMGFFKNDSGETIHNVSADAHP